MEELTHTDIQGDNNTVNYVFFELDHQIYGLETRRILEMVILQNVTPMPQSPPYIRGVINLRGSVVPVMDLRTRFNLRGMFDEVNGVVEVLKVRKLDHINWLNELKASVVEEREFNLQTDPHKCGFGLWYDSYHADNSLLRIQLKKFDTPHKRIHGIAHQVLKKVEEGEKQEALNVIQRAWENDLAEMIHLFDETDKFVRSNTREIVLVTESDEGAKFGIVVDNVVDVQDIHKNQINFDWGTEAGRTSSRYIYGLAHLDKEVRILVNYEQVVKA